MPQGDLETLSGVVNYGKISSEMMAESAGGGRPDENDAVLGDYAAADVDPDFPPESFWLSKDAEYDWFDRNAVYERKDSAKGNSTSTNLNPSMNPNSNPNYHRFSVSLKSKTSVIGLPKTQKTAFVDPTRRTCKPANIRLFPKRSESVGKTTVPVAEPGSPKVSCMGRVRSKRCRRRSNSLKKKEKTVEKLRSDGEKPKTGFYSKVMRMFGSKKRHKKPSRSGSQKSVGEQQVAIEPQRKSVSLTVPVGSETVAEPPGLGGLNRFASGRRSDCWVAEDFN